MDMHEFLLTPQGTALMAAYYPVWWDTSAVGGPKHKIVLYSVVQEIDVSTGLELFQCRFVRGTNQCSSRPRC